MDCPVCHVPLDHATLMEADGETPALSGYACPQCEGSWVPADTYFDWRDALGPDAARRLPEPVPAPPDVLANVADTPGVKRCPLDGRRMRRLHVAAEAPFSVDQCDGCNGAWFDGGEWQAVVAMGLHDRLTHVFDDAWQLQVERTRDRDDRLGALRSVLGADDFDETERVRAWVWAHPQRHRILGRIAEHEGDANPDAASAV